MKCLHNNEALGQVSSSCDPHTSTSLSSDLTMPSSLTLNRSYQFIVYSFSFASTDHGLGGLVSAKADVYSNEILLIETFSGKKKKPTEVMFETDMSLKQWIHRECAAGGSLITVIDPKLLNDDRDDFLSSKEQCFSCVMELALSCTTETTQDRGNMIELAAKLKKIRKQFLTSIELSLPNNMETEDS
ncbi:hypothetical protein Cgig2_010699 [Carnegiea gigantea]|uniref:Uncharacterized protein n=1 Tax=Carnegiea gigantea TaxID=171969 RepID=A0A9Q1KM94_9CARY|nr:hypothetical protein Cgig2_010699 [Carnegiea gigantea]